MSATEEPAGAPLKTKVSLLTITKEWTRLGCIGFGGPPTHIALLRQMCVEERNWIGASEFEDGIAATSLLPGPASTQLAIFCAWRLRGPIGGILGGICFIVPGLILILCLSAAFLARHPPTWILGAAAGAGAAVPAVAIHAARGFVPASWKRIGSSASQRSRWITYGLLGGAAAATIGPYLVIVLLACGLVEVALRRERGVENSHHGMVLGALVGHGVAAGGLFALAWVAFKVGALSYGGGFVIVPLMQHDAVTTYHWMTGGQFLDAVALGQVTPGPVVLTTAVVGYAASGVRGGLLATVISFTPSFLFVLLGGPRFDQIRSNSGIQSFLTGAGPAVIGAIAGSSIPLGLAFQHDSQIPVLAGAVVWLFALRRGVVSGLMFAGGVGVLLALSGVPV
ncbi:MAG TPA: chromate efflux transporter [Acidimicrobiales bacterium]